MTDMQTASPEQSIAENLLHHPFAIVKGQALSELPKDLYIPPDAMKVLLEAFEGPLDLLLYLIRKQNLDILDIPIASVTKQYMEYIELMHEMTFELAAEYLVMAAMLAEIKSRMLLPRQETEEEDEADPRAELVRRLQEYERYKKAAEDIDLLDREERDLFPVKNDSSTISVEKPLPEVDLKEVLRAFMDVLQRVDHNASHQIEAESLSIREKMTLVLDRIQAMPDEHQLFIGLFDVSEGRLGVVVTFLAVLELLKQQLIEFVQAAPYAPIYLKSKAGQPHSADEIEDIEE